MEDYFAEHILQYLSNDDEIRALSPAIVLITESNKIEIMVLHT